MQQQSISNKLFTLEGTDDSGYPVYTPAAQVQQVCLVVDGFIYVANAEPGKGEITGRVFYNWSSPVTLPHHPRCFFDLLVQHLHRKKQQQCLQQVKERLRWPRFGLCSTVLEVPHPSLSWCSPASPENNLRRLQPPEGKIQTESGPGVELPVCTWQRDSACPSCPTAGW